MTYSTARRLWKAADSNHWQVAYFAYKCKNRRERLDMAGEVEVSEDTIDNLASAYRLFDYFRMEYGFRTVRNLRRQFPYTRWATVYRKFAAHEFSLEEAREWLENFDGGNDALAAELENKYGAPEWERRANTLYREALKMSTDFGTPAALQQAATNYIKVFEEQFPRKK